MSCFKYIFQVRLSRSKLIFAANLPIKFFFCEDTISLLINLMNLINLRDSTVVIYLRLRLISLRLEKLEF